MIRLRPYESADAQTIVTWIGDEVSFRQWCADRYDHYPITAEDIDRHYAACAENGAFFPMTAVDETEIVGHLIMRYPTEDRSVIRFGFVIVDDKKRGMGYGKEMLNAAIRYAFDELKARKITLGVFDNNASAYRCYRAVGFREIAAEQPERYHVFGEDWKQIEMALVKENDGEDG